jgi:hypothetical protein
MAVNKLITSVVKQLKESGTRIESNITFFSDVTPCSLLEKYQSFGEPGASILMLKFLSSAAFRNGGNHIPNDTASFA